MDILTPDWLTALSAVASASLTLLLLIMAFSAWRASVQSVHASREANEQARRDSIEQTRPNVYVEVIPSLAGGTATDIRITNAGNSSARELRLEFVGRTLPVDDLISAAILDLFNTGRTLPPHCRMRAIWNITPLMDLPDSEGLGMPHDGAIRVSYTSDDPSRPQYVDTFEIATSRTGITPEFEDTSASQNFSPELTYFSHLASALVRRVEDLGR